MQKPADQTKTEQVPGIIQTIDTTQKSVWADRFILAAIAQGALTTGLTGYFLYQSQFGNVSPAKIVAAGGAGMWLTVGYLVYIVMGPMAAAVTALFYRHIEARSHKPYRGWSKLFAWTHLVAMNVGVVGATWLMMSAGYRGGELAAILGAQKNPVLTAGQISLQVHTQVMEYYPNYIAAFILIALIGAAAGGLGYVLAWRKSLNISSAIPR